MLALVQAVGISGGAGVQPGLVIDPGMLFRFTTVVTLVTGTMFVMWLGERITEQGLGNGISILIFAGIVAGLPSALAGLLDLVRTNSMSVLSALFIVALVVLVTAFVVFVERGQRKITVNYAKRQVGNKQGVWGPELASAARAEHGRGDSADLRIVDHSVPGHDHQLVLERRTHGLAA